MAKYIRKQANKYTVGEWKVYNHITRSFDIYTLDDLKLASATLPLECKDILETDKAFTLSEQYKLIKLADLSMQVWGGGPNMKLPWIHMDDYYNAFYINMCKYLNNHNRDTPGTWVSRCKFIGFDTVNGFMKEFIKDKKMAEALETLRNELMHLYPDAYYISNKKIAATNPEY